MIVKAKPDQIDHDIVTGTDGRLNGGRPLLDQLLGISQPDVGSVSQSGDPHQVGKIFRLGIDQHLHGEVGSKLRNAQSPQLAAADILRPDPQRLRTLEQAHNLLGIQRNILYRIQADQVLEHPDHGGIIVPQNIQLQQVVVDGMVVKVGGDGFGGHVVGRMLDRRKGLDHLAQGKNNDSARMLSRGPADADAALDDPVDLAVPLRLAMLLKIIFHIAVSRFIRQGADGPCPEGLSLSEDHLRIIVGAALIFSGKVQVDIRLLIAFKS